MTDYLPDDAYQQLKREALEGKEQMKVPEGGPASGDAPEHENPASDGADECPQDEAEQQVMASQEAEEELPVPPARNETETDAEAPSTPSVPDPAPVPPVGQVKPVPAPGKDEVASQLKAIGADVQDMCEGMESISTGVRATKEQVASVREAMKTVGTQVKGISETVTGTHDVMEAIQQAIQEQNNWISRALSVVERFRQDTLNGLQRDVEAYKKRESGEAVLPLIKAVAEILVNSEFVIAQAENDRHRKNLQALFDQLWDALGNYNVHRVQPTTPGDKHNTRIATKRVSIKTLDPELKGCVAASVSPACIMRDEGDESYMRVIIREVVDLFVHSDSPADVVRERGDIYAIDLCGEPACMKLQAAVGEGGAVTLSAAEGAQWQIAPQPAAPAEADAEPVAEEPDEAEPTEEAQSAETAPDMPEDGKATLTALLAQAKAALPASARTRYVLICPESFDEEGVALLRQVARDAAMNVLTVYRAGETVSDGIALENLPQQEEPAPAVDEQEGAQEAQTEE